MYKRSVYWIMVTFCLGLIGVSAQTASHPEKGSSERTALLNTLRGPVETELKQKIVFVVHDLNVQGNWAFVNGSLQTPDGSRPDFKITKYRQNEENGALDSDVQALFRKTGGKWKIVTKAIGCTDVCYVDWWRRFKAPKTIFPYTE
ncbi:MAG TPA: hypothetical protein VL325_01175 [Pyrinomonadaceae bacterium]|nr:hypothetical protein [Pyrinomonadaceae bacterium]